MLTRVLNKIRALPIGHSLVTYQNRKYGVTRSDFNKGASHKVFAEELGGKNIVSLNYYTGTKKD